MKHTKGPWSKSHNEGYGHDLCIGSEFAFANLKPVKHKVRFICDVRGPGREWNCPSEETLANANLIAAAPELLEACKKLLEDLRVFYKEVKTKNVTSVTIRRAEQAIKKATDAKATENKVEGEL